ncbi:MAG: lysozyme inhibitor LprI family protein [Bacillota bacterium]|nr:lysozyme inhibitor LprI family protein [Bacillota bacterium]
MNKLENEISDCLTNSVSELNPSFELKENTFSKIRDCKKSNHKLSFIENHKYFNKSLLINITEFAVFILILIAIPLYLIFNKSAQYQPDNGKGSTPTITQTPDNTNDNKANNTQKNSAPKNTQGTIYVTKIEGRREEFLGRLDSIQNELDVLPEKKASEGGTTAAMKIYYGECYNMYDSALNEIYSLLEEQLSKDTMNNLQTEEDKWIKQKQDTANNQASQYEGGTFESVAYSESLYESTKKRCYELVNNYMTDSKIKINVSKQDYINKLYTIENELTSSQEYINAQSCDTNDMYIYNNKQYNKWDATLNEIYSLLKQQLPADEIKKLNIEESQWVTQKENKAKKLEGNQNSGNQSGNISPMASLANTTQSRCYELIYRYMKLLD